MKYPLFLSDFTLSWILSIGFRRKSSNIIFSWKLVQWELSCSMRTDEQTHRQTEMTKLIVAFCSLANAPVKKLKVLAIVQSKCQDSFRDCNRLQRNGCLWEFGDTNRCQVSFSAGDRVSLGSIYVMWLGWPKPGTHYPHVTWADIKLTFYFHFLPYPFPYVGSHVLISIIWWLGVI